MRLNPAELTEALNESIERRGISEFQKPFVLQTMLEKVRGQPRTLKEIPVDVQTFVEHPDYMNRPGVLYPLVMDHLVEINREGAYDEIVLTGSIGSAKTTLALYTMAYQLYRLLIHTNPHATYGLDSASEIVYIFQSLNYTSARQVDYQRFKEMIEQAPWFRRNAVHDPKVTSKLVFPGRVEVIPVSGQATAAIGQNVIGGVIDELNYMAVVDGSSKHVDRGTYDQAVELYNSIARRRASRFRRKGVLPGLLCLVSSKRYPGQFTDLKTEEAASNPRIYIYDKRTWEIKPDDYTGKWFNVFVGDESRKPRILDDGEEVAEADAHLVMAIPLEEKREFESDIINALREIAGVATLATFPFIMQTDAIGLAMKGRSRFNQDKTDFDRYPLTISKRWDAPTLYRFAHVDLGLSSDSAGVAIGHVKEFVQVDRGHGHIETMPYIVIDAALEVAPPAGGEISFEKVRDIFYVIRDKVNIPLKWITYDSYQSVDSLQLLRGRGFMTWHQSMDKSRVAYELLKTALYQNRILLPEHPRLRRELASLENDPKSGKVDHPPHGSKDIADAVAGVVYGLTMRREIWRRYEIPPAQVPSWLFSVGKADSLPPPEVAEVA